MHDAVANLRYALRQFRLSPVFTAAAVLTLALGIGGTTAIFSLIHAVMLQSLPVSDPARLYRIGDGDDCCVEGGPQNRWGIFSFPLYERLKTETPEFEELTAFQAGRGVLSVRRQGVDSIARPLRSEYVTGNYFSTLGVRALGGRVFTPEDDKPSAPPVVVLSHRVWQTTYASDPSLVGATLIVEDHPLTVVGIAPAGFFGETLQSDPPDLWIPIQQEPMIRGDGTLLRQPVSAWLRVIGRLRPGATTDGMAPRLTGVLRQWIQNDSGYPSNWMPDVIRALPKQTLAVVPAGAGVAVMKEEYGRSLQILLAVCGLVLLIACANVANLLLARGVTRRGQTAVRLALGATTRQIVGQALTESILLAIGGGIAGILVAMAAARLLLTVAFRSSNFLPISTLPSPVVLLFRLHLGADNWNHLRRCSRLVCYPCRPRRRFTRFRPRHSRSFYLRAQSSSRCASHLVRRAGCRRKHARAQSQQTGASGFRIPVARARHRGHEQSSGKLHPTQARRALSPVGITTQQHPRSARFWAGHV